MPSEDWKMTGGAYERTFRFEDAFGPFALAGVLARAGEAGRHPRFVVTDRTLLVRTDAVEKGSPDVLDAKVADEVDRLLGIRDAIRLETNPRPARALIRLWLEAQDRYESTLLRLGPEHLGSPAGPGATKTLFEEAVVHPTQAGYGYLAWIRRVLSLPDSRPAYTRDTIGACKTVQEVLPALKALRQDLEATVGGIPSGKMEDRSYLTNWGSVYEVDGMLEHAVMHWHRHRLQMESALAAGPKA